MELLGTDWCDSAYRQTSTWASFALSALCQTRLAEQQNGAARVTQKGRGLAGRVVRIMQNEDGFLDVMPCLA